MLHDETCVLDGAHFFVKANIEVPLRDADGKFVYTVWVSLAEVNFRRAVARWSDPLRTEESPYFGWIATRLPAYPDTLKVKAMVHTQAVGERPLAELEPTDHPLAVEQREGITMERVCRLAEMFLHAGA